MANNDIMNNENEVIEGESTVITTVEEKEGLFTKTKKWVKKHEDKIVKIGVGVLGFAGGLLVGETIGKCKSINSELIDTNLDDIGLDSKDIDVDVDEF
jgi:hypothetical protein